MFIFWWAGVSVGFPFILPLIQAWFLEFAWENIYELMYLAVLIDDTAMF